MPEIPNPDPILAALGGTIPAARAAISIHRKFPGMAAGDQLAAICDLALRALDAMERPAPADGRTYFCAECVRLANVAEDLRIDIGTLAAQRDDLALQVAASELDPQPSDTEAGARCLFHVQDGDRPMYVIARDWNSALDAWWRLVRAENEDVDADDLEGPDGISRIAREDEVIIDDRSAQEAKDHA